MPNIHYHQLTVSNIVDKQSKKSHDYRMKQ